MNQKELIKDVFLRPRDTFQRLPSNRILWVAVATIYYFGIVRVYHPRNHERALELFGSEVALFLIASSVAIIMIPVGAWIMKLIIRIFGKKLSVRKIINIYGCSLFPRVIGAVFGYAVMSVAPGSLQANELNIGTILVIAVGMVCLLYALFLTIYGIVVSPNESSRT